MADPLSIGASIAGLLSITYKITSTLYSLTADAPSLIQSVVYETQALGAIFYQLQNHLLGVGKPSQHTEMVAVEQVVGILTGCVCTFSELEAEVDRLGARLGPLEMVRWMFSREPAIRALLGQLQMQKSSLGLLLVILHTKIQSQAYESMLQLHARFDELIYTNRKLSDRLKRLEAPGLALAAAAAEEDQDQLSVISSVRTVDWPHASGDYTPSRQSLESQGSRSSKASTQFEVVLQRSRVYNRKNNIEQLLYTGSRATVNHTMFSGLTLGNISNLSVFELPVCAVELSSRIWYGEDWEEDPLLADIRNYYASSPSLVLPGSTPPLTFLARALDSYTARPGMQELSFSRGAEMKIQSPNHSSSHWIATTYSDGKTGLVPSSLILLSSHSPGLLRLPYKAIVMYSYKAKPNDEYEFSVTSGEALDLWDCKSSDRSFWRARKKSGECGVVPKRYLGMISEEMEWDVPQWPLQDTPQFIISPQQQESKEGEDEDNSEDEDEARTPTWMRTSFPQPQVQVVRPFIGDVMDEWYDNSVTLRSPTEILVENQLPHITAYNAMIMGGKFGPKQSRMLRIR